jgi:peptidoglycan hydrolase-like protein with peptidoglycan-binding domain
MITMFDSVDLSQLPHGDGYAYAGYADGKYVNVAELRDRFPGAHILSIAVDAAHDADCLDIETGDATPDQAAAWFARQKARGVTRPCLYASAFLMDTEVIPAIRRAGIGPRNVRLWSAHYNGQPHRCGPASCKELGIDADGTQWTDRALGRNLDQSLLSDDFFGTPPAPPPAPKGWTAAMIADLPTLVQGNRDHPGTVQFVHRLQALTRVIGDINKLPAASAVAANGAFDQTTHMGVLAVQKMFGLTADGQCGPRTWAALVAGQRP